MGQTAPDGLELKILPLPSYAQRRVEEASVLLITRLLEMKAFRTDPRHGTRPWTRSSAPCATSSMTAAYWASAMMQGGAVVDPVQETPMLERFRLEARKRLTATEVKTVSGDGISQLRDILHHLDEDDTLRASSSCRSSSASARLGTRSAS